MNIRRLFLWIILCALGALAACGGGSGNDQENPTVSTPPAQDFPVDSKPTFGETIDLKRYLQNSVISPLTLPEATGGNGALTHSLSPIPDGLEFNSDTQVLSGIPTMPANTEITYTARDTDGDEVTLSFTIEVVKDNQPVFGEQIINDQEYITGSQITPLTLPEATGGNGILRYNLSPLPAGLRFSSATRVLSGVVTFHVPTTLDYTAQDEDGDPVTLMFTIRGTQDLMPTFNSWDTVGDKQYIEGFPIPMERLPMGNHNGNPPHTYSLAPLPAGLEFNSDTQVLSGTPTTPGYTDMIYTLRDADGDETTLTFSIEVAADTVPSFGAQTIDVKQYLQNSAIIPLTLPEATGGNGTLTYSLAPLPDGLIFDNGTRELSGNPATTASTETTYTARDEDGDETTLTFTIEVVTGAVPVFGGQTIADQVYIQGINRVSVILPEASGGDAPLTYSLSPLPDGLIFDSGTRELSGSPTTLGSTSITYAARDEDGDEVTLTFNVIYRMSQTKNICSRTKQVKDAILDEITDSGITCDTTTEVQLAEITELQMGIEDLTSLQAGDFDDLAGLTSLTLNGNSLTSLPEDIFDGLSNLTELWLAGNSLTTLPEDVFDGLSSLEELYMDGNALSSLPEDVFEGLSNLKELWLSRNNLTTLPEDVFDGLSSLTELYLVRNNLTTLPEDVFDGLSSLTELWLSNNSLTTLPEDVFDGLSSLTKLWIDLNDLSSLPEEIFDGLSGLKELNLSENDLTSLSEDIFDGLSGLTKLWLSSNSLTTLPEDLFDGLSNLRNLYLIRINLSSLSEDVFEGLSGLWELYLGINSLSSLPEDVFDGLSSLGRLSLYNNNLSSLPEGLFDGLPLFFLDLRDNSFNTPPAVCATLADC